MTKQYKTKHSGDKQEFATGMHREVKTGVPRYDLIPTEVLERLAMLYARGAEVYGDRNWEKGQPWSNTFASLLRHVYSWRKGDRSEDHGAAVLWNMIALMFYEENRPELDDLGILDNKD